MELVGLAGLDGPKQRGACKVAYMSVALEMFCQPIKFGRKISLRNNISRQTRNAPRDGVVRLSYQMKRKS